MNGSNLIATVGSTQRRRRAGQLERTWCWPLDARVRRTGLQAVHLSRLSENWSNCLLHSCASVQACQPPVDRNHGKPILLSPSIVFSSKATRLRFTPARRTLIWVPSRQCNKRQVSTSSCCYCSNVWCVRMNNPRRAQFYRPTAFFCGATFTILIIQLNTEQYTLQNGI